MTLFEAIRELKEGQAIVHNGDLKDWVLAKWEQGAKEPELSTAHFNLITPAHIIDLPKPKMTLEEGLEQGLLEVGENCSLCVHRLSHCELDAAMDCTTGCQQWRKDFAAKLRGLHIDWQAEADRAKEGK